MMSLNIHSVLAVTLAFGLSVTDAQIDAVGTCDPTGGMYDGFRCKQSCSAVTCAVGCKGCECGLDCTGANCAESKSPLLSSSLEMEFDQTPAPVLL